MDVHDQVRSILEPRQQRIWTMAEVNDFYNKLARGKIDPAKAASIEVEINQALQENRITG